MWERLECSHITILLCTHLRPISMLYPHLVAHTWCDPSIGWPWDHHLLALTYRISTTVASWGVTSLAAVGLCWLLQSISTLLTAAKLPSALCLCGFVSFLDVCASVQHQGLRTWHFAPVFKINLNLKYLLSIPSCQKKIDKNRKDVKAETC